jgi:cell division protein FtsI (penicillin-binding protein 3)
MTMTTAYRMGFAVLLSTLACSASAPAPVAANPEPRDGTNVVARIADEEAERVASEWGATRAVIVVLDPKSGTILASVGREAGKSARALASEHAWITGSTLKTLTVASALEEHTVTEGQRFGCGERSYGSERLHDAQEGACASLDLAGIVARSSNVGVTYVFDTLGAARLRAHLTALHIGDAPGWLPTIEDDHGILAANFAGGEVAKATPLQLARAYAAVFDGGMYVLPSPDGAAPRTTRVFSEETAGAVVRMLENAVSVGTGQAAAIAGRRVAGKTGTAEWTADSGGKTQYASFVGAVLDREPRLVALVGLEVPGEKANGPKAAAPAWGRLVSRILAVR